MMTEQQIQDDFISILQGKKVSRMDAKWRVVARMVRNILIKENNIEEQMIATREQNFEKRIGKVLQARYLITKQRRTFAFKSWILALFIGASGVYATKEYLHFTTPLPLELTHTQEELEGQDPKLFWKKWFNNGTFILFGSRRIVEPLKTNIAGCDPEAMSFKSCSDLLKTHPYNANLLFNLGLMYENGYDIDKNYSKAIEFYKRSAALGNHYALLNYEYLINQDLTK